MIRERERVTQTPDGRKTATWRLAGPAALIMRVELRDAEGVTSTIKFDAARLPDLTEARDRMPRHADLWDAIRTARLHAVLDTCELPACTS
jgi:hypothetical protein